MSPVSACVQLGRFRLPLCGRAPRIARELAADVADAWSLGEITDRVRLAVSEVVTNALLHATASGAGAGVVVEIARVEGAFHLTVHDGSRDMPAPRDADEGDEGGRGLMLLGAMTDDFGWYATPFGKAVWFSMKVTWPSHPAEPEGDDPSRSGVSGGGAP